MGKISTSKNANGGMLLEITYGGADAPFGGIDTSAPAPYIDPNCFVDSDGFIVVDNKLTAVSLIPYTYPNEGGTSPARPQVFNGTQGVTLLKSGTFYCEALGTQLNYMFGVSIVYNPGVMPGQQSGATYTFYMSTWAQRALYPNNQQLSLTLYDAYIQAVPASLTVTMIPTNTVDQGTSTVIQEILSFGTFAGAGADVTVSENTIATIVSDLVGIINGIAGSPVTATASLDGLSLTYTAVTPGHAGNAIQVQDNSQNPGTIAATPPYYFTNHVPTNLIGGTDAILVPAPLAFTQEASVAEVGGVLYIANLGPFMLTYNGVLGGFKILTLYTGARTLSKFAGSLIGLGQTPQIGTVVQSQDMIFLWSSAENLSEWNPVTVTGNVTGAGFAQIADISDPLTGLIISNNTAYILRSQGLTYATATSNGTAPYNFANIGLGDSGEGAPIPALICQYDQMGMYIGNTQIYGLAQQPSPVGNKIKNAIFNFLNNLPTTIPTDPTLTFPYAMDSTAGGLNLGGTSDVFYFFMLGTIIYIYNGSSGIWTKLTFPGSSSPNYAAQTYLELYSGSAQESSAAAFRNNMIVLVQNIYNNSLNILTAPVTYQLAEGLNQTQFSNPVFVTFPQEEIMFGREITVDSILISVEAYIPDGSISVTFTISGQLFTTIDLLAADFNDITANPTLIQVFPGPLVTLQAPQLKIMPTVVSDSNCLFRIVKCTMFASFDPNQRPV